MQIVWEFKTALKFEQAKPFLSYWSNQYFDLIILINNLEVGGPFLVKI